MKYTQNFNMKIPEGGDPIDISDITGNFETLDEELSKKASSSGGDISSMTVKTLDTIATEFPVPSAGESSKTFMGKVRKFIQDFNNIRTGLLTLGQLVNNGQTTEPGFALDARYGKTLYDLYAQLNANKASTEYVSASRCYPKPTVGYGSLTNPNINSHRADSIVGLSTNDLPFVTNLPTSADIGILRTTVSGAYCLQEYSSWSATHCRLYNGSAWSAWRQL